MEILNKYLCPGIIITLFVCLPIRANADDKLILQEQEIKAGLLYNFLRYTEWPAEKLKKTPNSMEVCIFGEDPFSGYLRPMAKRTVNQRKINIRSISSVREADKCNLLFVNSSEKQSWPQLADFLKGKPILTVSDFQDFSKTGGMIEFGLNNSHISAALNMQTLKEAQLRVQNRLLNLVSVEGR